eukprot:1906374-Amphidinium_carterae.1
MMFCYAPLHGWEQQGGGRHQNNESTRRLLHSSHLKATCTGEADKVEVPAGAGSAMLNNALEQATVWQDSLFVFLVLLQGWYALDCSLVQSTILESGVSKL